MALGIKRCAELIKQIFISSFTEKLSVAFWELKNCKKAVLFLPGFGQNKYFCDYFATDIAKECYQKGWASSFLFDYTHSGESTGVFQSISLNTMECDSRSMVDFILRELPELQHLFVVTFGLGSIVADHLFSQYKQTLNVYGIHVSPYIEGECILSVPVGNQAIIEFHEYLAGIDYTMYNNCYIDRIRTLQNLGADPESIRGLTIYCTNFLEIITSSYFASPSLNNFVFITEDDFRNQPKAIQTLKHSFHMPDIIIAPKGMTHLQSPVCHDFLYKAIGHVINDGD